MSAPILPIRRQHSERVEMRASVPDEVLDLIADLNTRLLVEASERAKLEAQIARVLPIVDAIVDHARKSA